MPDRIFPFLGNTVALVVRGKESAAHHPNTLNQHADCILPDGGPRGFFGKRTDDVSWGANIVGALGGNFVGNVIATVVPGTGLARLVGALQGWDVNSYGMSMKGYVLDYHGFRAKAAGGAYVNLSDAAGIRKVSTVLIVPVTPAQAAAFTQYWRDLAMSAGTFNFAGRNCSTGASGAFVAAKLLDAEIPGLDTPDHLYDQLVKSYPGATSHSGYVGFIPKAAGYDLIVRAV